MNEPLPLALERLPKQTLHHAWAPKLGRPIVLASVRQLRLWALLEANPGVTRYCERPNRPEEDASGPCADFWGLRDGQPVWLTLQVQALAEGESASPTDPAVVAVTGEELDRHSFWIANWLSLLPYLSNVNTPDLEALHKLVEGFFVHEASFEDAEQHFTELEPVLVRTAIIAGLHRGRLYSSELLVRPWDLRTRVTRCPPGWRHAPQ